MAPTLEQLSQSLQSVTFNNFHVTILSYKKAKQKAPGSFLSGDFS